MARFILGHGLRAWGARDTRIARALYRLDRWFFDALLWLIRALPLDAAVSTAAALAGTLAPRRRKSAAMLDNLRVALPQRDEQQLREIARECWANAGRVFAEYAHMQEICDRSEPPRLQVEILGRVETFDNPARPAVFVAAHQANWELVAAAIVRMGVPLSAVYSPPTNPLLDELLARWRRDIGCELLPSDESMRPMMRALSRGQSLGIVMDRRVDSGRPIPFFGHDKPSTLVPARLALRYGCELVPARIERIGKHSRFRVSFMEPIRPDPAAGDELAQAIAMTREVHALFEQWISERPEQWFCSKRLWPKPVYDAVRSGN